MQPTSSPAASLDFRRFEWFLDARRAPVPWRDEVLRLLPYAAGYALLHGLLVSAGYLLSTVLEQAVAIWPAVGLLCAMLTVTPRRSWPLWIGAAIVGRVVVEYAVFGHTWMLPPLLFSGVNAVEALVFAVYMQKPLLYAFRQARPLYLAAAFAIVSIASAGVGGLCGALAIEVVGYQATGFWQAARLWAASDFLGMLLVAPLTAWLLLPQIRIPRRLAGWPEYLAMPLALIGVLAVTFALAPAETHPYRDALRAGLAALTIVPVLWAALRADYPMVAGLQILLAVVIIVAAMNGVGPFAHGSTDYLPALAEMQVFLMVGVLTLMLFTYAVLERHQARAEARLHQDFSDLLVTLTGKMMNADSESLDPVIEDCLRQLADFAGAQRCGLLQIDRDGRRIRRTHAWAAPGLEAYPEAMREADIEHFRWAVRNFEKRGFIVVEELDLGMPDGAEELELVRQSMPDTGSFVYIGLFSDSQLIGAIGFGFRARTVRWTSVSSSLIYLVGQLFANTLQRKAIEADLDAYQQKLRSLATAAAAADERNRRKTAVDLHDNVGQNLAVARMKIGQMLAGRGDGTEELTQVRNLVDDALRGTRYLIADLSPAILYELGLVPALQSLAERFEPANDITCRLHESGEAWSPDNDTRIALYRAVQACLDNVARHAQAQAVDIHVRWSDDALVIEVRDDGVGFKPASAPERLPDVAGFGLFSLRENLALLGGSLSVDTARGIGTTIRLEVPRND